MSSIREHHMSAGRVPTREPLVVITGLISFPRLIDFLFVTQTSPLPPPLNCLKQWANPCNATLFLLFRVGRFNSVKDSQELTGDGRFGSVGKPPKTLDPTMIYGVKLRSKSPSINLTYKLLE